MYKTEKAIMRRANDLYCTQDAQVRALLQRVEISGIIYEPCVGHGDIAARFPARVTNDIDRGLPYVVPLARRWSGQGQASQATSDLNDYPYYYAWGNNAVRAAFKGRRCRVVARGAMNSCLLEFENGERLVTSCNALRRRKESKNEQLAQASL